MNPLQRLGSALFHGLLYVGLCWVGYLVVNGFIN